MPRHSAYLAIVAVALAHPAYGNCRCEGCAGKHAERASAIDMAPCCAANTAHTSKSNCCGTRGACAAEFNCPSCSDSGEGCACSVSSQPSAAASAPQTTDNHAAPAQTLSTVALATEPSTAMLAGFDLDRPVRYGGLRLHAFLGVWVI